MKNKAAIAARKHTAAALAAAALCLAAPSVASAQTSGGTPVETIVLSQQHCMVRLAEGKRYLLLPVEERAEVCNLRLLAGGEVAKTLNVRLAVDNIDYYVPLDLSRYGGKNLLLDVHTPSQKRMEGDLRGFACWKAMSYSDTFDAANREKYRPQAHHTPPYGWMNDPNGMFYKDGTWHLYYQHNPYGSQWENMHWRHSTSTDLINWKDEGVALEPDGLGTVFSGSCVVDKENTAGFGPGAVVAMFTSAGENQTQSLAYSTDNGKTFTKYAGNPVITSDVPDFRDPHIFWNGQLGKWSLILAAGQEMQIYSSADLKQWTKESSFGQGYGNHDGVWECPDLFELPVEGTEKTKWVLVCNINPGGPAGGSATQYFVGSFDGRTFKCESAPSVTKWMDYGKDHYATVSFDNAPDGRRVAMGWMSNWQYANQVPTKQYRAANTIARDLGLYEYKGETYVSVKPSEENLKARGKAVLKRSGANRKTFGTGGKAYEMVVGLKPSAGSVVTLTLSNKEGEQVAMAYDTKAATFTMDRRRSGETAFSDAFPAVTTAPVHGSIDQLRIFVDRSSIEVFDANGRMAMTNIVFPASIYDTFKIEKKGKCGTSVSVYEFGRSGKQ